MRLTIFGSGYVGLVTGACMAEMGNHVVCVDIDEDRISRLNAGEVELPDQPKLQEQLLTLVIRGSRIDHQPGDHDDWANAAAGAIYLASEPIQQRRMLRVRG